VNSPDLLNLIVSANIFQKQMSKWRLAFEDPDFFVHSPAQSRVSEGRLLRVISNWILNISKDGDFTMSLGNLFLSDHPHSEEWFCYV